MWDHLANVLGWQEDLLPCPGPGTKPGFGSRIQSFGKVPGKMGSDGFGYGFKNWPQYAATAQDTKRWAADPRLGICVNTRRVRAVDIDVPDPVLAAEIRDFVLAAVGALSYRYRNGTGKCLIPVIVEGDFPKTSFKVGEGQIVEFLATGQQFVAYGLHEKTNLPYLWNTEVPISIPTITFSEWQSLVELLYAMYGVGDAPSLEFVSVSAPIEAESPIDTYVRDNCTVLEDLGDKIFIQCPFNVHDNDSTPSTAWLCHGHNGLEGAFSCLHAKCEGHKTEAFLKTIGYQASLLPDGLNIPRPDELVLTSGSEVMYAKYRIEVNADGIAKDTVTNVYNWLSSSACPLSIKKDTFTDNVLISSGGDYRTLLDTDIDRVCIDSKNQYGFEAITRSYASMAINTKAADNAYDSAIDWIESLAWDGIPRIDTFLHRYFACADNVYSKYLSRYIWSGLAGRILKPGCQLDIVPILVGTQGQGKTRGLQCLVPEGGMYVNIDLGKPSDDVARIMRGVAVAEWGEVKGIDRKGSEYLKSFISDVKDTWVPKYKEHATVYYRRCMIIGTTNPRRFFNDPTGHRRYAPIRLLPGVEVDRPGLVKDRIQLWAEGREMFKAIGIQWHDVEKYCKANESEVYSDYLKVDPWEDTVLSYMDEHPDCSMMDIMTGALMKTASECSNADMDRLSNITIKAIRLM